LKINNLPKKFFHNSFGNGFDPGFEGRHGRKGCGGIPMGRGVDNFICILKNICYILIYNT
jgi:hypothetical protein